MSTRPKASGKAKGKGSVAGPTKGEAPPPQGNGVTLLRLGVGKQVFELPGGATLGDLLRLAGIDPRTQSIFVDAKPIHELLPLRQGMIISVVPEARNASDRGSWRETVGMFRDDEDFAEMIAAGRAIREADREAIGDEPGLNDT